jgi:perosamine synthetase
MRIYLSRPDITEAEIEAVCGVLRGPNLALGPKLREFEEAFARYARRKHAIGVNSGTSGLYLCVLAMGIGPGDEVITTPFTFIATSNSIMMAGAKPVFVDIDPVSLNIDPARIEAAITKRTKAVMPVEIFGNPAGFEEICEVAARCKLAVIEDSCEALGSVLGGRKAGTFGAMSVFGFYPNKQMTTGEGGMILTDDDVPAELCFSLRNQGRGKGGGWLGHERLGYNFRLSDINAAVGLVQLGRIERMKAERRRVARWYQELLGGESRLIVPEEAAGCEINWFVFVVRLAEGYDKRQRDRILEGMQKAGIQVSNYFPPVHLQPFMVERFGYKAGDFPVAESVSERTIALPFYNNLRREDVQVVCEVLRRCLEGI